MRYVSPGRCHNLLLRLCAARLLPPAEAGLHEHGHVPSTCPVLRQNGKLPLHYAVEKGATLEVVKLLLGGQGNATTATAEDKVRRCATTRHCSPCHISTPQLPPVLHPVLHVWPC